MGIIGTIAAIGALGIGIATGANTRAKGNIVQKSYDNFQYALKNSGLDQSGFKMEDIFSDLYGDNQISHEQYTKYAKLLEDIDKTHSDGTSLFENLKYMFKSKKDLETAAELYDIMARKIPAIKDATKYTLDLLPEDIRNSFLTSASPIAQVAAPMYEDVNFKGEQLEVDPVKLWTGQELADLHSLNFDPNSYYDLVKQGTSAGVDYSKYTSDQLAHAAGVDDTKNVTSYLDAIRSTKAESLAAGATLGARAANEILANTENINNYANNQSTVAQNRFNAVNDALLTDAQARLTAKSYYENLAKSLSNDSALLYANDTDRFGQEMLSNAEMYKADQELRGQRAYSNASMYANYVQAAANINAANAGIKAQADEYAWVFDRFLGANNGDLYRSIKDFDQYLIGQYTGKNNYLDYLLDKGSN